MLSRRHCLAACIALVAATGAAPALADEPMKVVYHVNEGNAQATAALRNIRNHLDADPTAKIVVVTHSKGIDFLLDGAKDGSDQPYAGPIGEMAAKGVKFRVCANTLTARKIPRDRVVLEAEIVPSGVAEVSRLQAREGYVYLKP